MGKVKDREICLLRGVNSQRVSCRSDHKRDLHRHSRVRIIGSMFTSGDRSACPGGSLQSRFHLRCFARWRRLSPQSVKARPAALSGGPTGQLPEAANAECRDTRRLRPRRGPLSHRLALAQPGPGRGSMAILTFSTQVGQPARAQSQEPSPEVGRVSMDKSSSFGAMATTIGFPCRRMAIISKGQMGLFESLAIASRLVGFTHRL